MESYIVISYSLSLILLFACILCFRIAVNNPQYTKLLQTVLKIIGVVPGFLGVIWGVYVQLKLKSSGGLAIMSAWLLLEIGSVQLLNIIKKFKSD